MLSARAPPALTRQRQRRAKQEQQRSTFVGLKKARNSREPTTLNAAYPTSWYGVVRSLVDDLHQLLRPTMRDSIHLQQAMRGNKPLLCGSTLRTFVPGVKSISQVPRFVVPIATNVSHSAKCSAIVRIWCCECLTPHG